MILAKYRAFNVWLEVIVICGMSAAAFLVPIVLYESIETFFLSSRWAVLWPVAIAVATMLCLYEFFHILNFLWFRGTALRLYRGQIQYLGALGFSIAISDIERVEESTAPDGFPVLLITTRSGRVRRVYIQKLVQNVDSIPDAMMGARRD